MKEKLPFIIYIGIGAALMAASLPHMDGYYGNMVFWVGFGTVCAESVQLLKYCWWRVPRTQRRLRSQTAGGPHQRRGRAQANAADAGGLPGQPAHVLDPAGAGFCAGAAESAGVDHPHTVCAVDLPVHRGGRDLPPPGKTAVRETEKTRLASVPFTVSLL